MKQRIRSLAAAALLVSSGAVSAAWDCGHDLPDCVSVTMEPREIWIETTCGYPNAIGVTVENGLGSGVSVIHDGFGTFHLGPPIDTDKNNPAYYADTSCCQDIEKGFSCAPDQLPTGVRKGE